VIEFKDDRVGFATVDARMRRQIDPGAFLVLRTYAILVDTHVRDMPIAVLQIPLALVLRLTRAAPPLQLTRVAVGPIEFGAWLRKLAP